MLKIAVGQCAGISGEGVSQSAIAQCRAQLGDAVPQAVLVVAAGEFADLVRALIAQRRSEPADDLISDLANNAEDLTDDEVVASVVLLLNAGHEASVNVFGNGLVSLLERGLRPADNVALTVEEMLRFDSALQLFERTATEPVEVEGVLLEPGQKIAAMIGSANRDPLVFDRAGEFDVTRDPNPHLAFGVGVHFCLGSQLAKVMLRELFREIRTQAPNFTTGEPELVRTNFIRGVLSMPFDPGVA